MIKIVSFKLCPFVRRVVALLEAKEVPYDIQFVSLNEKLQWFLDMSPTGKVPMLITGDGDAMFKSGAIVEYIEDVTTLLDVDVTPSRRSRDRAWSYHVSEHDLVHCNTLQQQTQRCLHF